jgi:hypothetical protein
VNRRRDERQRRELRKPGFSVPEGAPRAQRKEKTALTNPPPFECT